MPERAFKPRTRRTNLRDARLIIIATEGSETEPNYFTDLAQDEKFRNSRVHVEVLKRDSSASSPDQVILGLDQFQAKFKLNSYDELWLVIDVDRWGDKKLSDVARQCEQKNYLLAVSNPCFELWLLLHLAPLETYSDDERYQLFQNKPIGSRTRIEIEIINLIGEHNKSNLATQKYLPHVAQAIARAAALDTNQIHRWPNTLGTRVYRLVESIINK